jgi:uncharacterized protein DUF4340
MKSVMAHGVLALFGLLLAYRVWTHEEKEEQLPFEVTVNDCESSKLASVEIESPTHIVRYKPSRSKDGTQYWITTQTKKKPPEPKAPEPKAPESKPATPAVNDKAAKPGDKPADPADKKASDQKPADAAPKPPETPKQPRPFDPDAPFTFLASKKFDDTLKVLAPLRATRGLGEVPKTRFKEFGFDKVGTYLRVDCGGRKVTLEVGARTYGSGDQYARDPKTKQAYLVGGQLLMDLQSAQFKFMQNELHDFPMTEVDEALVKAAGKERRLLHRNRLVQQEARWVDATAPDKRNELFGNWFQRMDRLKVKSYLGDDKEPGTDLQIEASAAVPVMTVEYRLEGKPKGKLELVRIDTKQGNFYYARTEVTHRWTAMYDSVAKQAEDDVALVVGSEEAAAQSQSTLSASTPTSQPAKPAAGQPAKPAAAVTKPAPQQDAPRLPPSHPPIPH